MAGKAYLTRMPLGFSGAVTRPQDLTTEPVILDSARPFSKYGLAGKWDGNKFVPLEEGDTIDSFAGILIRPYPTQSSTDMAYLGVQAGFTGDRLARGYICVDVPQTQAASATRGAAIYVRVAGETEDSPLGSFMLAPDADVANTPEVPLAKVMGPGDGTGTTLGQVEIAYNI